MAKTYRQALGSWGEQAAAEYLIAKGYTILERNSRTPYGEIDLIAVQPDEPSLDNLFPGKNSQVLVFVEVKTRASAAFGLPEEAVTGRKRTHLLSSAQAYTQTHADLPQTWRIDVIAIRRPGVGGTPEIVHFENAVS